MLYVDDLEKAYDFWTNKMSFVLVEKFDFDKIIGYQVKPTKDSYTSFVLYDKAVIKEYSPGLNYETPSILFHTEDLVKTNEEFKSLKVDVSDLEDIGGFNSFHFNDGQGNYFAVKEV